MDIQNIEWGNRRKNIEGADYEQGKGIGSSGYAEGFY